jgi:hypothetical protein
MGSSILHHVLFPLPLLGFQRPRHHDDPQVIHLISQVILVSVVCYN